MWLMASICRMVELTDTRPERTVDLQLVRGAVLSGRVTDDDGEPVVGVQVTALVQMPTGAGRRGWGETGETTAASTDDRGEFRLFGLGAGEYVLAARRNDGRTPAARTTSTGRRLADVLTYYPGTTELAEAQRFMLAEAAEYSDLAFSLQALPSISVSGRVVVSADRIRHGFGQLMPKGDDRAELNMGASSPVMVERDGTFRIDGVTAGTHRLSVRVELSNGEAEVGQLEVTASDEDISGLVVSTHGATTVTGRVVAEPAGARLPEMISVGAMAIGDRMNFGGQEDAIVKPDGRFELKVFHSPVKLYLAGLLEGWAQSGVRWKGHDVRGGLNFDPGQPVEGVEFGLRRATSRITGTVSGVVRDGEDGREGTAIAFRDGADDFSGSGVAGMIPIRGGRFTFGPMAAGDYQVVAVRRFDRSIFGKPDVAELLRARATDMSVGDNETRTVNLALITDY